jgi:hypothetical protein
MKQEIVEILARLKELGGNIDSTKGDSLYEDLLAVTFDTVLYADFEEYEEGEGEDGYSLEIGGLDEFFKENKSLYTSNRDEFVEKMLGKYFRMTEDGQGQCFWQAKPFTPFKEGTFDFMEWNSIFAEITAPDFVNPLGQYASSGTFNVSEIMKATGDPAPEFMWLFHSYGFPDEYFICLSDPNPDNPTVYGTDHEVLFYEISNEGSLSEFLNKFYTKEQFVKRAIGDIEEDYLK